ncbi:hypothetical protein FACS1894211_07560 [Clostridia bacterium]|nr:hypothetical protein FACS1894211_07560 [Clostridia bacterium]
MKDLRCSLDNCAHNKGYMCRARNILVTEEADCATYKPEFERESDDNIMFEAGMEGFSQAIDGPKIHCSADACVFNKSEKCVANGISVLSEAREPVCASFSLK